MLIFKRMFLRVICSHRLSLGLFGCGCETLGCHVHVTAGVHEYVKINGEHDIEATHSVRFLVGLGITSSSSRIETFSSVCSTHSNDDTICPNCSSHPRTDYHSSQYTTILQVSIIVLPMSMILVFVVTPFLVLVFVFAFAFAFAFAFFFLFYTLCLVVVLVVAFAFALSPNLRRRRDLHFLLFRHSANSVARVA